MATNITIKTGYKLPRIEDGAGALLEFAEIFGDDADTYAFLGRMKDTPARQAREILAARMILAHMVEHQEPSFTVARRAIAKTLGYEGTSVPNFYRIAEAGQAALAAAGKWDISATVPAPRPHS